MSEPSTDPRPERSGPPGWALALVLFAGTLLLYARVAGHGFVNYDDDRYVTANEVVQRGLTGEGMRWAFSATHASNWHPLTWLSHMLDVELYELEAGAHHATSVLLHALAALVLFLALRSMTARPWTSFLAAALFALHPLRVESVAWIAERKDVLSGLLAALVLLAYTWNARRPSAQRYALLVLLFVLGLLAKPMLVTLPFALLLLDLWPLRRTGLLAGGVGACPVRSARALVVEKLPLFALAAASCAVTVLAQRAGGATELLREVPFALRLENALASVAIYVRQSFWPTGLACFYPHAVIRTAEPASALLVPATIGAGLAVGGIALGLAARRSFPALLVGWLWFLGTLVPVLGIVQVGTQAHADRYTYLPSIGLALLVAFGAGELVRLWPALRWPVAGAAAAALALLAAVSVQQIETWRDPVALWERALTATEGNYVAHNNLGRLLADAGDMEGAAEQFERSLEIRPGSRPDPEAAAVRSNLAGTFAVRGRFGKAIAELQKAAELDEQNAFVHGQLGMLLVQRGRDAEALPYLERALALQPEDLSAANSLAWVLATSRDDDVRDGARALPIARRLNQATEFTRPELLETLAAAQAEQQAFDKAVRWQTQAIGLAPPAARGPMEARLERYRAGTPWRKSP